MSKSAAAQVRLRTAPTGGGGGGGTGLIQSTDITHLGSFRMPLSLGLEISGLDLPHGLTGRYVGGQLRLYTLGETTGYLQEYIPPSDGSLSIAGPFTAATAGTRFDDIFQDKIVRLVPNGYSDGGVDTAGRHTDADTCQGIYWDPIDSRMYWTRVINYNNLTSDSDTCLGYSTLNDGAGTGTAVDMWKLSQPNNYPTSFGNRWCHHLFPIPAAFAAANCPNQRLGVGFGGGVSIISNGPFSEGPCLFAIKPPELVTDPHWDYMATSPKELLFHPATARPYKRAPRPASLYTVSDFDDQDGTWWNWADGVNGGCVGAWIDGPNKQGVVLFASLAAGNTRTTIAASPTPTHTTFSVVPPHDIQVGNMVKWDTDTTHAQLSYPFCSGRVSGVSGNDITIDGATIINGDVFFGPPVDSAIPYVGGPVVAGAWYQGGGTSASHWNIALYIYDPADLATAAGGGTKQPTPSYMGDWPLGGQTYPFLGTAVGGTDAYSPKGAWFDSTTKRLYVLHTGLVNGNRLIYVYSVNC